MKPFKASAQRGKPPNLALVKSKLTIPVPMPLIIAALQSWKQKGRQNLSNAPLNTDEKIAQLETGIRALESKIQALENKDH